MKKLLLTLLVAMLALSGFARDIVYTYEGKTLTYTVIDEEAKTVQTKAGDGGSIPGNDVSGELVIPSQIKEGDEVYDVVKIGEYAFYKCSGLTSITIPESVTTIGEYAFYYCCGLTSITIPESVSSIGSYAFYYCSDLTSITIPESVTAISDATFYYCSGLTSITIPETVTSIDSYAFFVCYGLTSITIPESVTTIGAAAFGECTDLTSITIPESVTTSGASAFEDCTGLTSITIPESVTTIGECAFKMCYGLTSITIPKSVTSIGIQAFGLCQRLTAAILLSSGVKIGEQVFYGCSSNLKCAYPNTMDNPFESDVHAIAFDRQTSIIDNYTIYGPERKSILFVPYNETGEYSVRSSVTEIGAGAYSYLPNLTTIEITNDVTTIGNRAFANCKALENVILPMKLETLGSAVFENSSSKNVVFNGPTPVESTSDVFDSQVYEDATLYVRSGRQSLFMTVSPWKFFYNITDEAYSGVEDVIADFNEDAPCEVFNLNGVKVGENTDNLPAGIYVVRQGNSVEKIAVK